MVEFKKGKYILRESTKSKGDIGMQRENEYGRIIAYERKRINLSSEQLCEGICDRVYLQRIEKGERSCDKILADSILQRIGVSAKKFSYILDEQEKNFVAAKEKIVDLVDANQEKEAYQQIQTYREQTKGKTILYVQFCNLAEIVLKWKNGGDRTKLLEDILATWNLTKDGKSILRIRGQRLSYFELSLALLYMRLLEEQEKEKEVIEGYQELLVYMEKRVEESDRVEWYPQIAVRLIRLLKKNGKTEQAWKRTIQTIQLLRKQAFILYLAELLKIYQELLKERFGEKTAVMSKEIQKQISDIDEICEVLDWCEQKYKVKQKKWVWDISFGMSEIYLCQDIIKGRRIGMGLTQQELGEGICSCVTVSRIENGKSYPKRKDLIELLEKVKWSGENCTLTAQIGNPEYHQITSQISDLTYLGNFEEAEKMLEELEKNIQKENIFAKQYFLSSLSTVQFALGKKTAQELYILAEKALHLTMPENEERWKEWHFTRTEVMCINMMSYACESVGKIEYVIELLKIVKEFYERQHFSLGYYQAGYQLTLRNLGNLLGNIGKYKEASQLADMCIQQEFIFKQIGNAAIALYDKGWNMEHLWENGEVDKQESLNYIKASCYLNLFLNRKIQYEHSKKHMKELYGEDIYYLKNEEGISK